MTILQRLSNRQRFKFENTDTDSWEFDGEQLTQYISGELAEGRLVVQSLTEEALTIRWPDDTTTSFSVESLHWE